MIYLLYLCTELKKLIMTKFEVLSPDGFTIEFDKPYYTSKEKAFEAFDKWKERYNTQGYYSSNNYGRIPLEELEDYMNVREL
jgi:transposase InsO family protein